MRHIATAQVTNSWDAKLPFFKHQVDLMLLAPPHRRIGWSTGGVLHHGVFVHVSLPQYLIVVAAVCKGELKARDDAL
jgi:hypothetical protein